MKINRALKKGNRSKIQVAQYCKKKINKKTVIIQTDNLKKIMESNQDTKKNFHYALSDCGKSWAIQNVQV